MRRQFTRNRDLVITKSVYKKKNTLLIHNGKTYYKLRATKKLIGYKLGEFSLTKKLGCKIHDSARNKKKKAKKQK